MAKTFNEIKKYNPYHGKDGKFTGSGAASSVSPDRNYTMSEELPRAHIQQLGENRPKNSFSYLGGHDKRPHGEGLKAGIGERPYSELHAAMDEYGETEAVRAFTKHEDLINVRSNVSMENFYDPKKNEIFVMARNAKYGSESYWPFAVETHECGHAIDANVTKRAPKSAFGPGDCLEGSKPGDMFSCAYKHGALKKALLEDYQDLIKKSGSEDALQSNMWRDLGKDEEKRNFVQVSDMISAANKNKWSLTNSHTAEYWNLDEKRVPTEVFAECMSALTTDYRGRKRVQKYFLKTLAVMRDMMVEINTWEK